MKRLISTALLATGLVAVSAVGLAQDCSDWNMAQLAGTYTMSGSGWVDLSKALPGMGLPSGLVPIFWVGATTLDQSGNGGGWLVLNAAGNQMTGTFVNKKYSIKTDCTLQATYSLRVNELGVTIGPFSRTEVLVVKPGVFGMPGSVELHSITTGTAPGTPPGALIDAGVSYRISMKY